MTIDRLQLTVLVFCALVTTLAGGCAAPKIARQAVLSQSHLDDQSGHLSSAVQHLQEAEKRLAAQPDPRHAAVEVHAAQTDVQQAAAENLTIHQDVQQLSDAAQSLQREIDAHQNDLLGPRARRIRDRVLVIAALLAIGAALLQLGPLLGGPAGGAIILAGHVLTAFATPIFGAMASLIGLIWSWVKTGAQTILTWLTKIGSPGVINAK